MFFLVWLGGAFAIYAMFEAISESSDGYNLEAVMHMVAGVYFCAVPIIYPYLTGEDEYYHIALWLDTVIALTLVSNLFPKGYQDLISGLGVIWLMGYPVFYLGN